MSRNRRISVAVFIALLVILGIGAYTYRNVPLRTAIFRSFVKGNFYLTSEEDTLYSFGWYGVRKWLVEEDKSLRLLAENDSFCDRCFVGWLIGRSGEVCGDYLYVATRSYLANGDEMDGKGYENGSLIIMRKGDLEIVDEYSSDIKLITAKKHGGLLVVSGLKGFDIYDVSEPSKPVVLNKYRQEEYTEFQGLDIFETDSSLFVAFARFGEGVSIHDISEPKKPKLLRNISLRDSLEDGSELPRGLQCFGVEVSYPYLYATIGPISSIFETENDRRGILVADIHDLDSVKLKACIIPKENDYEIKIGDPSPTFLCLCNNKIYTNYGEKGVAVFDISEPKSPKFETIIEGCTKGNVVYPIYSDSEGRLFMGAYHWPDIYRLDLN